MASDLTPEALPCRECGAVCSEQEFSGQYIDGIARFWICSQHKMLGGKCPSDVAYFSVEDWNARPATPPAHESRVPTDQATRYYIDCEFDGHNGPLLSIALVEEGGRSVHIEADVQASDPWVLANVVPLLDQHGATDCTRVEPNEVGNYIRWFIGDCQSPVIIADSPVDIGRFCAALSTGSDGGWASANYPRMTFEVHNVDCYPTDLRGAVQHNAWWDAMALRHKLSATFDQAVPSGVDGLVKRVAIAARDFCAELQEDGEGVPQPELKRLLDALDAWEARHD